VGAGSVRENRQRGEGGRAPYSQFLEKKKMILQRNGKKLYRGLLRREKKKSLRNLRAGRFHHKPRPAEKRGKGERAPVSERRQREKEKFVLKKAAKGS